MDPVRQVGEALDAIEPRRAEGSSDYSTVTVTASFAETSIPTAPPARSWRHAGRESTPRYWWCPTAKSYSQGRPRWNRSACVDGHGMALRKSDRPAAVTSSFRNALAARCRQRPLAVLLDEAHMLDLDVGRDRHP